MVQYLGIFKLGLMNEVQIQSGSDWYVRRYTELFTGIQKINGLRLQVSY
jgi:hypothetical protein